MTQFKNGSIITEEASVEDEIVGLQDKSVATERADVSFVDCNEVAASVFSLFASAALFWPRSPGDFMTDCMESDGKSGENSENGSTMRLGAKYFCRVEGQNVKLLEDSRLSSMVSRSISSGAYIAKRKQYERFEC